MRFPFAGVLNCAQAKVLECEIIEVSSPHTDSISGLSGINFLLIHHAKKSDRKALSKWLKNKAGTQVTFFIRGKEVKGILFRLSNCFGRGLLLYKGSVRAKKHDLIKLILP